MYKGKIYVSNFNEMKNEMLKEMHNVSYAINVTSLSCAQ
jgi:hypothetical protein